MPTLARYRKYRKDQTTIWISKSARTFFDRERDRAGEGTAQVVDRLIRELRSRRKTRAPKRGRAARR